jgi:hypothetical protein
MKYTKFIFNFLVLGFILVFSSCDTTELDLFENPSTLNPSSARAEFVLNNVQLSINNTFNSLQFAGAQVTRLELMRRSTDYLTAFEEGSFNGAWTNAYANSLVEIKLLNSLVAKTESEGINMANHKAVSKLIEAYTMSMMVDYFNNVPYSEAALGSANFNPKRDSGRDIYEACYNLTNEAIALLTTGNAGAVALTTDIYYGGNMSKWLKFAHSLKLQLVVNSRLKMNDASSRFNSILTDNNFITSNADDFQFNYNTTFTPDGDYRHPIFTNQYLGTPEIYLCKSFIDYMAGDPRRPYYFYRQTANGDNFARPHGNTQAIVVSDQIAMTVHGYFPYGGKFDDNTFGSTNAGMGLQGAGKNIFLSSYSTHFLIAEAQLTINNNPAAARTALSKAVTDHMNKVRTFGTTPSGTNAMTTAMITTYVNNLLAAYDASSDKLEVVMREFYKASWGNGVQSYNNYRRTGKPTNLAPSEGSITSFVYRMFYPSVYIINNLNPDAIQSPITERIWWAEPSLILN